MTESPARLGRYAVRRRLGSGAFATVWLAYDEQLDCPVAVKVLAENWADDGEVHRRFLEEGRFLRRVESPYVVPVYDAGELPDGRPYLVMAFADQGTLADRVRDVTAAGEPFTSGQALAVLRQVGSGLQALHDRGVLHRDVKPANVLFRTTDGPAGAEVRAMLGDLGLGKALDASSRLTMVAGTPSYVAPEQAQAESPDARADQYSLGALAYLLLSGRPAFRFETLRQAADPAPPDPLPGHPAAVDAVVRRALARDREERWPDVASFVTAVEDALGCPVEGPTLPWLPLDPDLTHAGPAPSIGTFGQVAGRGATSASEEPRDLAGSRDPLLSRPDRRGSWPYAAAALLLGTAAAVGAFAGARALADERVPDLAVVTDVSGTLEAEVPGGWTRVTGEAGWTAPQDDATYPALSVGSETGWTEEASTGHGVFLALMPGTDLPERMPGHPECESAAPPYSGAGTQPSRTVVHSGCPGGVTVERVVQVAADRILWVQVRSPDTATANRVLDSVTTRGI